MKRFALPILLAASLAAQISNSALTKAKDDAPGVVVPASYFGLTVINSTTPAPLRYTVVRSWDTWPHPSWSDLSPSRAVYNFAPLDQFIAGNKDRDMIYTLGRTPQWASSRPGAHTDYGPGQCAPPTNLADWDDYVRMVASRSAGRIKYWELWNEPQNQKYYCGDIPTMVTLAQHASRIIKSIDPSAKILSPSPTSGAGPAWLNSFLSKGGAATVDIIAFHGYASDKAEDVIPVIAKYRAVMQANGVGQLPMWDTEGSGGLTPGAMAAFLSKTYLLERSEGVSRFLWYAYDIRPQWGHIWNADTGTPPGITAYGQTYQWMVGASLVKPCSVDGSNVWSCTFSRPGYQAEAIWNSTAPATVAVSSKYREYRDLLGNVHPIADGKVNVGSDPILIETRSLPQASE